jgi:hypothetical protein
MAFELIVNDRYYSYNVTGALKRMTELTETLKTIDDNDRDFSTYLTTEIYDLNDYIDFYAKKYAEYITRHQLIKICKYRAILNKLKQKLQQFDLFNHSEYEFSLTSYFDNKGVRDTIIGKMQYYSDEYNKFLESIGLKLYDTTQDKLLYELLN